ncbi:M20/M25/M40 family metallo-hydrolase [Catenulispora sp. NF23]|uniref:M20/M25/M40 family metallo-hydrolase n=1 Tax=Catenulispora pinistramenti TaxID=2705254 RepID=A0ABS5L3Z1_9ACTN|nr:M20/M25/M40 family metallo-hydrolase [Catenulispora pinistramenti]MBS2536852.1 M20/M25/M40 family metallo-hydrolase [Catenulispora pinistramenti]MBS2552934.1 M20/M25/M40 family metallo-hydrolase [Catenulispora pinistramenti]
MTSTPDSEEVPYGEVVGFLRDLIRIDTSNPIKPERPAAEYVAEKLAEAGLEPQIFESDPGRASVVARIEGSDPSADALLLHGHLDVVPADPADWTADPFGAEVRDGMVWGRGAVDMKDMDAMMLAVTRRMLREGRKPRRDIVLAFLADEEAGGNYGAKFLAKEHPDLFDGVSEAVSEVGGYSYEVSPDLRFYLIETAQKGLAWMRLQARGQAGHGSMINDDNAVTALAEAVARIGRHEWPVTLTPTVTTFLTEVTEALGVEFDPKDPDSARAAVAKIGPLARFIGATLQHTANPTKLEAGYKVNVIPERASAEIDGRFLPGLEQEYFAEIDKLLGPDVTREFSHYDIALEAPFEVPLVEKMMASLQAEDPAARIVPYCLSAGTDNKTFGVMDMGRGLIRGYGFVPLRLDPSLDFAAMFHGVDERVPLDALEFGCKVLDRFLTAA